MLPSLTALQPFQILVVGSVPIIVLPLLLELAVLGRAGYTRESTDIVLAAVAVPCLFVSMWAVVETLTQSGGVYWGGLFSMAVGGFLLFLVLTDAVVGLVVPGRATE